VSLPKPDLENWMVAKGISSSLWVSFTVPFKTLTWAMEFKLIKISRIEAQNRMPFKFMSAKVQKDWRIAGLTAWRLGAYGLNDFSSFILSKNPPIRKSANSLI
jgi:hypothetical protein